MIASLVLSAALLATPNNFQTNYVPTTSPCVEVSIVVDPTSTGVQAGFLGFESSRLHQFVQAGWVQSSMGYVPFVQVWRNGTIAYTGTIDDPLVIGSSLKVGITTNSKGQWLTWIKTTTRGWDVPWMGNVAMTPKTGVWEVATESFPGVPVPPLSYKVLYK